ncbi:MarR family transcriptional regulator [Wukongibacter baidiensis]|uniref:MarR family winged helix-turn-helix transcriptional regulator n=1 Tax=Wukongibacter baidiensis TaxID=1723361 RepID=UPI003D7FE1DA
MKEISDAFGRRLKKSGITRIQWIALYYINANQNITQRELSKLMFVKDSSVGRLLDRLERDNMIKRIRNKEDRRNINIILTEEGKTKIDALIPEGDKFNNKLIEGLTEGELRIFEKVVFTMVRNIKDYE